MNKRTRVLKVVIAVVLCASTVYAFQSGPPPGHTNAPGELNCTVCHVGVPNSGTGSITLDGLPSSYAPNQEITFTVRVQNSGRRRWGFQLTALNSTERTVGTFQLVNQNLTQLSQGTGSLAGRIYVTHTEAGSLAGATSGEWQVRWIAPPEDAGRVTFYAAGNAANNNGQNTGDSIYTTSVNVGTGNAAPSIIGPAFKKGKFLFTVAGSGIDNGATVEVTGAHITGTETYATLVKNKKGKKWVVKASATSNPGGMTPAQIFPTGTTVTLVIRNPSGLASEPAQLSH